ncbi:hypothetical protein C8F04DRAFT_948841, partial [Mycena alexandri]
GFILKVKKILESICVNCGKLKADIVSRVSFPLLISHPRHPNFLRALFTSFPLLMMLYSFTSLHIWTTTLPVSRKRSKSLPAPTTARTTAAGIHTPRPRTPPHAPR